MTRSTSRWILVALLVSSGHLASAQVRAPAQSAAADPRGATMLERLHAQALASFRQGRFPEAYGRLIALADLGHPPSAELALWMYQQGTTVFGKDWDSTPAQLAAWSTATGRPVVTMVPQAYPRGRADVADRGR